MDTHNYNPYGEKDTIESLKKQIVRMDKVMDELIDRLLKLEQIVVDMHSNRRKSHAPLDIYGDKS